MVTFQFLLMLSTDERMTYSKHCYQAITVQIKSSRTNNKNNKQNNAKQKNDKIKQNK